MSFCYTGRMAAVTLRPNADKAAIIGEVNALIAAPAASGNVTASTALRIVRGSVLAAGTLVAGEGFTSAKDSTGLYSVTFTVPFTEVPVIVASTDTTSPNFIAVSASDEFPTEVRTYNSSGILADRGFSFIAMGV